MKIVPLTKLLGEKYLSEITALIQQISQTAYTKETVLREEKDGRIFHRLWDHSFIVFENKTPIAVLFSYEREAEGNEHYPENTLYLSTLAVAKKYQDQGIGTALVLHWLQNGKRTGFLALPGPITFSVQTNGATENNAAQNFYKKLGFIQRSKKQYPDHTDLVYGLRKNK